MVSPGRAAALGGRPGSRGDLQICETQRTGRMKEAWGQRLARASQTLPLLGAGTPEAPPGSARRPRNRLAVLSPRPPRQVLVTGLWKAEFLHFSSMGLLRPVGGEGVREGWASRWGAEGAA